MPVIGLALAFSALVTSGSTPVAEASTTQPVVMPASQSVEEYVRKYFKDAPVMIDIARCESRFRQLDSTGKVLHNEQGSSAVGVFQIMASIHAGAADKNLGLNIYNLDGNAAYARYLYQTQGTSPWNASKGCWGKAQHVAVAAAAIN
jgi:hypothetical protein